MSKLQLISTPLQNSCFQIYQNILLSTSPIDLTFESARIQVPSVLSKVWLNLVGPPCVPNYSNKQCESRKKLLAPDMGSARVSIRKINHCGFESTYSFDLQVTWKLSVGGSKPEAMQNQGGTFTQLIPRRPRPSA